MNHVLEPEREERLRTLLIDFALGAESGKRFDVEEMRCLGEDLRQMLGEITVLRTENERQAADLRAFTQSTARDLAYIERLEGANSALHVQFADEQRERELLVESMGNALGELGEYFRQANQLRGRGTPRSVARIATDNSPRFVTNQQRGSDVSTHIIGG